MCISVHPLSNRRDISSYFCKFAPICKAPLYPRMFGNLLYQNKKAFTLLIKYVFSMVLRSLYVFQCIHFPTGGIFFSPSVNLPLYVRYPYMKGCFVTFCINTGRLRIIHLRCSFNGFIFFVCISVHPLSHRWDISSYLCKFANICKAPLYGRMFGNLVYQHKKAFRLPIKYIFSMVLYSLYVFQFIHFPTGGIFFSPSVNLPLYVRRPY